MKVNTLVNAIYIDDQGGKLLLNVVDIKRTTEGIVTQGDVYLVYTALQLHGQIYL